MAGRIRVQKGVHIYRRPDSPTWYADISRGGRRSRRSTGTEDEDEACRIAREIAAETGQVAPAAYTLDDAYALWLKERERSERDKSSLRVLRRRYPNRPAHLVDNGSVAEALAGMKPSTYNRHLNTLRAALNLAAERGKIPAVPKLKRKPEGAWRVRFLSPEEWMRLRPLLPAHLLPAVEFSLATGLRRSNVLGLRWEQIDLRRELLHLQADEMKGGKHHTIPLGEAAMAVLRAQKGKHDLWVFPFRGKRISDPKTGFNKAVAAAGIENFHWHDLRHTWASWMAMSGAPLHAIMKAGAWATMDMVIRYSHLTPNKLAEFQDKAVGALNATGRPRRRRRAAA